MNGTPSAAAAGISRWGTAAAQTADRAIRETEALLAAFDVNGGMYDQAAYGDTAEALGFLRRARATIPAIVDARLAEERNR